MLQLYPLWAVVAMAYFVVMRVAGSKKKWPEAGAMASMSTWVVFAILMLVFVSPQDAGYAALLTLFLGWRHKQNFRNLFARRSAALQ
jgi:glycerol-3-phosphate acyltransferase PlsY